jgi:hypothetical protein
MEYKVHELSSPGRFKSTSQEEIEKILNIYLSEGWEYHDSLTIEINKHFLIFKK